MAGTTPEQRQKAREILIEVARAVDKRLTLEVREITDQPRLQVKLAHGTRKGEVELALDAVLNAEDDSVGRNELRLRLKRAHDSMLFRPMPDHRLSVKPVKPLPPPGGQLRRGQGRR